MHPLPNRRSPPPFTNTLPLTIASISPLTTAIPQHLAAHHRLTIAALRRLTVADHHRLSMLPLNFADHRCLLPSPITVDSHHYLYPLRTPSRLTVAGHNTREVDVPVVGGHAGVTILPLLSQVKPPCSFTAEETEYLTSRIQNGGIEVVNASYRTWFGGRYLDQGRNKCF